MKIKMEKFGFVNEDENNLLNDLRKVKQPVIIGNVLMHYVVDDHKKEARVDAIRSILNNFADDFLTFELPKGEVERIRKIIKRI